MASGIRGKQGYNDGGRPHRFSRSSIAASSEVGGREMGFVIEGIAVALALSALLLQPRRNPSEPPSWRNLSGAGRLVLLLILLAGTAKVAKQMSDSAARREAAVRQDATIEDLRATNQHLIKVMSVADGSDAHVLGVVTFDRELPGLRVEEALRNLFLKYVSIELKAQNRSGVYCGRSDYGAHPAVFRYLNVARLESSTPLLSSLPALSAAERARSFYFDIRCTNLKVLCDSKIQYANFDRDPPVAGQIEMLPEMWRDFRALYGVERVFVDRVTIEELGDVTINRSLDGGR